MQSRVKVDSTTIHNAKRDPKACSFCSCCVGDIASPRIACVQHGLSGGYLRLAVAIKIPSVFSLGKGLRSGDAFRSLYQIGSNIFPCELVESSNN